MAGKRKKRNQAETEAADPVQETDLTEASKKRKKAKEEADDDDEDEAYDDDEEEEIVDDENDCEEEEEEEEAPQQRVWRPGLDELQAGEQLDVEPGTYTMLHRANVGWPCLSFDIMRDDLGAQRSSFPMTAYVVAGTQAEQASDNRIYLMKWSNLRKTDKDGREDSDEENDDDSDSDEEPEAHVETRAVPHAGGVNRIRCMPQASHIAATWSDSGKVFMWNLDAAKKSLEKPGDKALLDAKPIFTCDAHKEEGFALDFNPSQTGALLTGGNDKLIMLWSPVKGGWSIDSSNPFKGHTASVEDLQWKRSGNGVGSIFASASADASARIWDVREANREKSAIHIKDAHRSDVNVLSWSPCVGELLATASDDGSFKVWDTRSIDSGPMANFLWHKKAITSIDWHPTDETMLVLSAEDSCVTLWDMAVEDDRDGTEALMPGSEHFPPQLMFVHQGQTDPKEVRWHPQLPGVCVCTAGSGFNIFKACNM